MPVSYTHLDVYKRQGSPWEVASVKNLLKAAYIAVSYTHLDVYKRQGIQGVGGIKIPTTEFMQELRKACTETGTILILDEIQSGDVYKRQARVIHFCAARLPIT